LKEHKRNGIIDMYTSILFDRSKEIRLYYDSGRLIRPLLIVENNNFKIISKVEGERMLEIFKEAKLFKKHCDEIVEAIRKERGKTTLLEEEKLPERA
jgi:hypothetical protein